MRYSILLMQGVRLADDNNDDDDDDDDDDVHGVVVYQILTHSLTHSHFPSLCMCIYRLPQQEFGTFST